MSETTTATHADLKKITSAIKADRQAIADMAGKMVEARNADVATIEEAVGNIIARLDNIDERLTTIEARTNDDALTERLAELKTKKRGWFS